MGILGTGWGRREGKEGHLVLSSSKMLDPHFQVRLPGVCCFLEFLIYFWAPI